MKNSQLLIRLKTLSKKEIRGFDKFLKSIYTDKSQPRLLYNYLKTQYPSFPDEKIDKKYVAKKVFREAKNPVNSLSDAQSMLLKDLKNFMIQKQLEKNSSLKDLLWLDSLKERRLDKLFFSEIKKIKKEWKETAPQKKKQFGIRYLYNEYELEVMHITHPEASFFKAKRPTFKTLIERLENYTIAAKLYWVLCAYTSGHFVKDDSFDLEKEMRKYALAKPYSLPQTQLLQEIVEILLDTKMEDYQKAKQSFFERFALYNHDQQMDLISFFTACSYRIGTKEAFQELFNINEFAIKKKLILEGDYVVPKVFINIVNLGCRLKKISWTEKFIKDRSEDLKEEHRENTTLFCEANLAISDKKFDVAMLKLIKVIDDNVFWSALAKCMLLQCYYELKETDALGYLIDACKQFLNRNKQFAEPQKEGLRLFVKSIEKIYKIRYLNIPKIRESKENLIKDIKNNPSIPFKSWLLEKLDELK